jgi:hypothetical protein
MSAPPPKVFKPSTVPSQRVLNSQTEHEIKQADWLRDAFQNAPIPRDELLANLGLFVSRRLLTRLLFLNELYQKILPIHGVILEFGTRWGQSMAVWSSLRGIYEPYNYSRRIIGFDTFAGFPSTAPQDGAHPIATPGAYGVTPGYQSFLSDLLVYHEQQSPVSHIRKFELVAGDATETVPAWLAAHPETIVAMAYFDFDLYEPTRACLAAIEPFLTKGSVIGFDEANYPEFPGETVAIREVFGLGRYSIRRMPYESLPSYVVID